MFKKELLDLVLQGKKTQTRRLHKRPLKEGRVYALQKTWVDTTGQYVKINRVYRQKLLEVTEEEAHKEGFSSLEDFKLAWTSLNGEWNPELEVIIYEFELAPAPPKQTKLE